MSNDSVEHNAKHGVRYALHDMNTPNTWEIMIDILDFTELSNLNGAQWKFNKLNKHFKYEHKGKAIRIVHWNSKMRPIHHPKRLLFLNDEN